MEIISENNPQPDNKPKKDLITGRNVYLGLVLIFIGVLWLLRNFDVVDRQVLGVIFSWQALLIVAGGYFMTMRKWAAGVVFMAIGVVFTLGDFLDIHLPMNKVLLPVILIGAGVAIFFQRK